MNIIFKFLISTIALTACNPNNIDNKKREEIEHEEPIENTQKVLRVLAIGNSFSEDSVEQNLYEIAASTGDSLVIGNLPIGGATLKIHYENAISDAKTYRYRDIIAGQIKYIPNSSISEVIKSKDWDIITVQQASRHSGITDSYIPYLKDLVNYIRETSINKDVKIGLHLTWAWLQDRLNVDGYYN